MFTRKLRGTALAAGVAAVSALTLAGCTNSSPAGGSGDGTAADGDCSAFKGKSIDLVIPYDAGGGYDILARDIIPGLENALDATVVPVNKPGAGGLLAINQLAAAKPDGLQIAIMNGTGAASAIVAEAEGPEFGFDDISYVGRVAIDDLVVATSADGDYQTWEDVQNSDGFRFGSTGRGASDYIVANALIEAFDLKNAEVVTGFNSQSETDLALIQGNVDAIAGPLDSRRSSILSGDSTGVLSFAEEAPEDIPDATVFGDLELDDQAQSIIDGIDALTAIGRPIVAPGGMDEGTLTCLQDALAAAVEDPEVIELAEKTQREISYLPGKEMVSDVIPTFDELSPEFVDILKASY